MPQSSTQRALAVESPDTFATAVRTLVALVATATLLFLFTPRVIHAQDLPGSHKVEAGESLWTLAVRFYGDGAKWKELATLNKLGDTGEKRLLVGQIIKVPEGKIVSPKSTPTPPANTPRNALARASQPSNASVSASASGALAAQTTDKQDAPPKASASKVAAPRLVANKGGIAVRPTALATKSVSARKADSARAVATMAAPVAATVDSRTVLNAESVAPATTRIWGVDIATQRGARGSDGATVFLKQRYDAAETESAVRAVLTVNKPRARTGEYASAPYAVEAAKFMQGAAIGRRIGGADANRNTDRLLVADEAELMLPAAGAAPAVGDRFVSVQSGSLLKIGVRMALPTGLLQVVRAESGRPVVVRVMNQTGIIEEGQHIFALEGAPGVGVVTTTPVPAGAARAETSVLWVENDALLPSVQSFVVLAAGTRDGVKAGDEFALISKGINTPEQRIAVVRVVRVTAYGSSALVVSQHEPLIAVGASARLIAKAD
ncbi:MAG: LysM peptidoglycan-binding domain-containing protein [Gemmatimonadota bacterium]|nr:LysM peptidoglycan-binding domain-containing protein [Gemmatimonadota bacterium]